MDSIVLKIVLLSIFQFLYHFIFAGEECFILKVSQNKWTFWEWFVDGQECVTCQIVQRGPLERFIGVGSWFTTLVAYCLRLLCGEKNILELCLLRKGKNGRSVVDMWQMVKRKYIAVDLIPSRVCLALLVDSAVFTGELSWLITVYPLLASCLMHVSGENFSCAN